jgi:omega-6 fatty acid desaturase (delta-12 desaturase)
MSRHRNPANDGVAGLARGLAEQVTAAVQVCEREALSLSVPAVPGKAPLIQGAPTEDVEQRKALLSMTAAYREGTTGRSLLQLVLTLGPLALFYTLGMLSVRSSWPLALVWAVPAAAFVVRTFILQHDCGHGSLFKSKRLNDTVGFWLGILTLTPYLCWRRFHAQHHADFGNLDRRGFGDILTLTHREYQARSPLRRRVYRLYRSPWVLLVFGPVLLFVIRQRLTYNVPREWRHERGSVHQTNLVLLALLAAITWAGALEDFLKFHLPMMALASSAGVWLFYVQHQFTDTYWRPAEQWKFAAASLEGSSYYEMPSWLRWLTANIGVHHIHHLDSRVPSYRLYECMLENPTFLHARTLTPGTSLRCMGLTLWDEDRRRMTSFHEV